MLKSVVFGFLVLFFLGGGGWAREEEKRDGNMVEREKRGDGE